MPPRAVWKTRPSGDAPNPLDVRAEQPDQDREDGNGAGLVVGAVLQATFLAGGPSSVHAHRLGAGSPH
jgi:hypothetical protein